MIVPEEWLNSLTDEQLRQMFEEASERIVPIEGIVATATAGSFACPRCGGTAEWDRNGRDWTAECIGCEWNACGMLSQKLVAH